MAVYVAEHPLVKHKLGALRRHTLPSSEFRAITNEITRLLTYEATKNLPTEKYMVKGWAGTVEAERIMGKKITAAPILRAGLGMLDGFLDLIPNAKVSVIGMFRNESTLDPVRYYVKLARDIHQRMAVILDPMLATGGSMVEAINIIKEAGCPTIKTLSIVAAPEGIHKVQSLHPDVEIYTACIDDKLDSHGYILPGLGDAGDRIFGTK